MGRAVYELLLGSGTLNDQQPWAIPAFFLGAGFVGVLVVILDWANFRMRGQSFLKLTYGGWRSVWLPLLWGLAAMIGAFLGAAFQIFKLTRIACISAGVSWPLVLPQLVDAGISNDVQDPTVEQKEVG